MLELTSRDVVRTAVVLTQGLLELTSTRDMLCTRAGMDFNQWMIVPRFSLFDFDLISYNINSLSLKKIK